MVDRKIGESMSNLDRLFRTDAWGRFLEERVIAARIGAQWREFSGASRICNLEVVRAWVHNYAPNTYLRLPVLEGAEPFKVAFAQQALIDLDEICENAAGEADISKWPPINEFFRAVQEIAEKPSGMVYGKPSQELISVTPSEAIVYSYIDTADGCIVLRVFFGPARPFGE